MEEIELKINTSDRNKNDANYIVLQSKIGKI